MNESNELVSIITPCYNGAKYIAETIDSVLNQTYSNWEMIIINDGSKDNSEEVIDKYVKKDKRIIKLNQENKGCAAARNNGIRNAKGRYIALLDADDIWHNNFLEEQLKFMKEKNAICVFSEYERIDANSKPYGRPTVARKTVTQHDMKTMNYIGCLTGLYDTKKYGKIYLKEELKSIRDDYAYWYDVVSLENMAYGNQKILAKYRVFNGSTTSNKKALIGKQYAFYRKYLHLSVIKSVFSLIRWSICGLQKFNVR